jgi:hypothetical protein
VDVSCIVTRQAFPRSRKQKIGDRQYTTDSVSPLALWPVSRNTTGILLLTTNLHNPNGEASSATRSNMNVLRNLSPVRLLINKGAVNCCRTVHSHHFSHKERARLSPFPFLLPEPSYFRWMGNPYCIFSGPENNYVDREMSSQDPCMSFTMQFDVRVNEV